jgi:hypothetical protein
MEILQKKLKLVLAYDLVIPLLGTYLKECNQHTIEIPAHTHVYSSIIYNSKVIQSVFISRNEQMDKENVVYTHNGVLFSHKEERKMDEIGYQHIKGNKAD